MIYSLMRPTFKVTSHESWFCRSPESKALLTLANWSLYCFSKDCELWVQFPDFQAMTPRPFHSPLPQMEGDSTPAWEIIYCRSLSPGFFVSLLYFPSIHLSLDLR